MHGPGMPSLGPFNRPLRFARRLLPPLHFITIHYLYFIGTCLLFAVIFWGSSTPRPSTGTHGPTLQVRFIDSLFLCVSAMTEAGLNTVNLSELNTFQQVLLFLLIILGSAIWASAFVVGVRKKAFETKFHIVIEAQRQKRDRSRSSNRLRRSWNLTRRSTEAPADEEAGLRNEKQVQESGAKGPAAGSKDVQHGKGTVKSQSVDGEGEKVGSSSISPKHRAGPETGGISNRTEEAILDSESESQAISPNRAVFPGISFREDTRFRPTSQSTSARRRHSSIVTVDDAGPRPGSAFLTAPTYAESVPEELDLSLPQKSRGDLSKYIQSASGFISRNSQFHGLSEKEREKLGGCEYRAISLLSWLVPAYFIVCQLLGAIGCGAWIAVNSPSSARENGLNPWWVGAFNAVSAFNNSGMSLLDANMTAYQRSYYLLITMSVLILAGNTCYPVFLRLIVWCMWKMVSLDYFARRGEEWEERRRTLRFLLDHPRRCYTNLFPAQHTWWLLFSVITLNGIDWAAFEILNINNKALYSSLPVRYRVIDGLFQAFAVRSGGFYVVTISDLRISLQVLYVVMMYISAYPIVITMRNSNVYEERSLGIYSDDQDDSDSSVTHNARTLSSRANRQPGFLLRRVRTFGEHFVSGGAATQESNGTFVRQQLHAQLAHDIWWIVLGLFLIMIIEGSHFTSNPAVFSVFNFIFEIMSGYGCVGISVGIPWASYSFCGSWQTLSKLILCAIMLRGRHRGLPVAIDKAVLLPGEEHWLAEEEDARIRMSRAVSRGRQGDDTMMTLTRTISRGRQEEVQAASDS